MLNIIQSVDSVKLAGYLSRNLHQTMPILLEVNIGEEDSKSRFDALEVARMASEIDRMANLDVKGLMTVAPWVDDSEEVRPFIKSLSPEATTERIVSREYEYVLAEDNGSILGVIAMRNGRHVYHLFVRSDAHNQGVARALWDHVLNRSETRSFTVNSSPYAVPAYERLGFRATDRPQAQDGLVFVPMAYQHGD